MINKDTILSVYTEKQTLLEYLTAIEKSLDAGVLVSASVVDLGSNKCQFVFTFEDGNKIVTPAIEFIKPVKGASIRDGVLYLVLADGTEVSAGSITASFGNSTFNGDVLIKGNAIVNGTIKQGTFLVDTDIPVTFTDYAMGIISSYYAHARATDDKLSIVFAFYMPSNSVEQKTIKAFTSLIQSTFLTLPSSILGKLHPSPNVYMDIKSVQGQQKGFGNGEGLTMSIRKDTSGLSFGLQASKDIVQGITEFNSTIWRFEFNFTLS